MAKQGSASGRVERASEVDLGDGVELDRNIYNRQERD